MACSVSAGALANYERGDNVPDVDFLRNFAKFTGADPRYVLGDRPVPLATRADAPPAGFVLVPRLDVRASAGNGLVATADELYGEPSVVPFREQWLRQLGVAAGNAQFLIAEGDSMFDTIAHGDLMLVDRGIDRVRSDGVYVVTYNGEVKVKRVQLLRDGTVLLKSDNPRYVTEEVPPHEVDQLAVAGRVRWVGGGI